MDYILARYLTLITSFVIDYSSAFPINGLRNTSFIEPVPTNSTSIVQMVAQCPGIYDAVRFICTQETSCVGACGQGLSITNGVHDEYAKVCSCDFLCKLYNDCCYDFDYVCTAGAAELDHSKEIDVFSGKTFECVGGHQMVTSCPAAADVTDATHTRSTRSVREYVEVVDILARSLSLTDTVAGISYSNQHVYDCHMGLNSIFTFNIFPRGDALKNPMIERTADDVMKYRTKWRREYTGPNKFDENHLASYLNTGRAPSSFERNLKDVPPIGVKLRRCPMVSSLECSPCDSQVRTRNLSNACTELMLTEDSTAVMSDREPSIVNSSSDAVILNVPDVFTGPLFTSQDTCNINNTFVLNDVHIRLKFHAFLDLNDTPSFVVDGAARDQFGWSAYQCHPPYRADGCSIEGSCFQDEIYLHEQQQCERVEDMIIFIIDDPLRRKHSNLKPDLIIQLALMEQNYLEFAKMKVLHNTQFLPSRTIHLAKPRLKLNSMFSTQSFLRNGFRDSLENVFSENPEMAKIHQLNVTMMCCLMLGRPTFGGNFPPAHWEDFVTLKDHYLCDHIFRNSSLALSFEAFTYCVLFIVIMNTVFF